MVDTAFTSAVSQRLRAYLQSTGTPGAALAVMQGGQVLFSTAEGLADRERGTRMTTSTLFGAGSITKTLTALVFLLLEREGCLHLDDPVSAYLSQVEAAVQYVGEAEPLPASPLRLHHLLSHSSGIPELGYVVSLLFRLCGVTGQGPYAIDDPAGLFAGIVEAARLRYRRPGAKFLYSNENFVLLAKIAEQVTGEPFAEIARTRLFGPLGMDGSSIGLDDRSRSDARITGYIPSPSGPVPIPLQIPDACHGPGGLVTTVDDLSRYLAFLLGQGVVAGQAIPAYAPSLWKKIIAKEWIPGLFYGLGWYIQEGVFPEPLIYHGGDLLFSGGISMLLPHSQLGIVVGQNAAGSPALTACARDVLGLLQPAGEPAPPPEEVASRPTITAAADLAGTYISQDGVYTVEAFFEGERLKLRPQLPGVGRLPDLPFTLARTLAQQVEFQPADCPPPARRSGCVFIRSNHDGQLWLQYENSLFLKSEVRPRTKG
jgi:CubicO group peptidase (beta-lactamase class C family)